MGKKKWIGLFFISLGVAMIIVDATIVNVAIPSIIHDLGISSSQAQWIQETYTLVFASTLLVFGRLADRFGRRTMFS
ncbi:MAG: MFS transporter, partial [Actinomycetes bacterium]